MTELRHHALTAARVLVTGASGFIGGRAVAALAAAGADVFALDLVAGSAVPAERTVLADITDAAAVSGAVAEVAPAFVLHLAALKDRGARVADTPRMLAVNAVGTANVLAAAAELPGLRAFVTLGTAEEYGEQPAPFVETMCERPASPYPLSKACAGAACRAAHALSGLPAVELRPTLAYGPGQPPDMFLPQLIAAMAEGRRFPMTAGGQTRDYVFVDDLVGAIVAALVTPQAAGRSINIGGGTPVTLAELAATVERLMGREGLLDFGELPYRDGEVMDYRVDASLARELLGWTPRVSLDDGLRRTIDAALGRG